MRCLQKPGKLVQLKPLLGIRGFIQQTTTSPGGGG